MERGFDNWKKYDVFLECYVYVLGVKMVVKGIFELFFILVIWIVKDYDEK